MATESVERRGAYELRRRGEQYEILEDGILLLGTYGGDSERALVAAGLEAAAAAGPRRVLLGGLGVGYALGAILADSQVESVTVAEPAEALVEWNRTYLAGCSGDGLRDPRVVVHAGGVGELEGPFDLICLEAGGGAAALRQALAPGGALAVWSAGADPDLAGALGAEFGQVECQALDQGPGAEPDFIYIVRG